MNRKWAKKGTTEPILFRHILFLNPEFDNLSAVWAKRIRFCHNIQNCIIIRNSIGSIHENIFCRWVTTYCIQQCSEISISYMRQKICHSLVPCNLQIEKCPNFCWNSIQTHEQNKKQRQEDFDGECRNLFRIFV